MSGSGGSGTRVVVGALAIIVAVTLGGSFAFRHLFAPPATTVEPAPVPQPAEPPLPADPVRQEAVVVKVEGTVEKVLASGQWAAVAAGDHLAADDSVRTEKNGRAELAIGDKSRLTVTASTELKIRELTQAVHSVRLTRGRLVASYDPDGKRVLRIEDETGTAVAETKGAHFSILSNGQALAVATETGTVNLNAAGKTVEIPAGQQALAQTGEAPSAATPIAAQLLLKIARARQLSDPRLCAVIEGNVSPGSALEVDGAPVPVDVQGRFKAQVPRRPGQGSARVAVRDVSGRAKESVVACQAEVAPPVELQMSWKDGADAG